MHTGWEDLANYVLRCHICIDIPPPETGTCGLLVNGEVMVMMIMMMYIFFIILLFLVLIIILHIFIYIHVYYKHIIDSIS